MCIWQYYLKHFVSQSMCNNDDEDCCLQSFWNYFCRYTIKSLVFLLHTSSSPLQWRSIAGAKSVSFCFFSFPLQIKLTYIYIRVDWYWEIWVHIFIYRSYVFFFHVPKLWKSPGYAIKGTMLLFFPTSINFLCTVRTFHGIINWTESNVYVNLISVWKAWCARSEYLFVYVHMFIH